MKLKICALLICLVSLLSATALGQTDRIQRGGATLQANSDGSITVTTKAGKVFIITPLATAPDTCVVGSIYFKSGAGAGLYQCNATDTWAALPATAAAIFSLSDVQLAAAAPGDFLRYDGTRWVDSTIQQGDVPAGLDATKLADGTVSNAELQRLDGITSPAQTQLDTKATTTALSSATSGLQTQLDTKATTTALSSATSGLQTQLDTKATTTALSSATSGLQTQLDTKATTTALSSATSGLQTQLDTKVATTDARVGGVIGSYTLATLPTPGTVGRIARVTDSTRGLWTDTGTAWLAINGRVANVLDFGAVGDGVTNDTAAIAAAIASLGSRGGVVLFPDGYTFTATSISLVDKVGVHLIGMGGSQFTPAATNIVFTGPGIIPSGETTPTYISVRQGHDIAIKGLHLSTSNATYAGVMIQTGQTGAIEPGMDGLIIEHSRVTVPSTALAAITLKNSINTEIRSNVIYGGLRGIVGRGTATADGYANTVSITENTFQAQTTVSIRNGGEHWRITNNTFQALLNGQIGTYSQEENYDAFAMTFSGNWIGDVVAPTVGVGGIAFDGRVIGLTMSGNFFFAADSVTGTTFLRFRRMQGASVTGNQFSGGVITIFDFGGVDNSAVTVSGNNFRTTGSPVVNATLALAGTTFLANNLLGQAYPNSIATGGLSVSGGNLSVFGNIIANSDNNFLTVDSIGSARMGFIKKGGQGPTAAYATGSGFVIQQSSGTDINPSTNTFTDKFTVQQAGVFSNLNISAPAFLGPVTGNVTLTDTLAWGSDLFLVRDAANTLAQRNAANAQKFNFYANYTDAANYTRGALSASTTAVTLAAESAGTGSANLDVNITPKGTGLVRTGALVSTVTTQEEAARFSGSPRSFITVGSGLTAATGGYVLHNPTTQKIELGVHGANGVTVDAASKVEMVSLAVGALGSEVKRILSASALLDYTALEANSCEVLTVTVTGVADDATWTASHGIPNALADVDGATERTTFFSWVSAADTVSVRRCNVTAVDTADPAAATVRVSATKF